MALLRPSLLSGLCRMATTSSPATASPSPAIQARMAIFDPGDTTLLLGHTLNQDKHTARIIEDIGKDDVSFSSNTDFSNINIDFNPSSYHHIAQPFFGRHVKDQLYDVSSIPFILNDITRQMTSNGVEQSLLLQFTLHNTGVPHSLSVHLHHTLSKS